MRDGQALADWRRDRDFIQELCRIHGHDWKEQNGVKFCARCELAFELFSMKGTANVTKHNPAE